MSADRDTKAREAASASGAGAIGVGRVLLALGALLYLGLGVWFLFWPEGTSAVGLSAESAAARTELRATYGGLELGLCAFLAWCAVGGRERLRTGLAGLGLTSIGFAIGRTGGLIVDRPAELIFPLLVGLEVATAAACALTIWKLPAAPSPEQGPEPASPPAPAASA